MTEKKGYKWGELPAHIILKLMELSGVFYSIRNYGMWIPGPAGYESEVFCVLRTHNSLTYDFIMPAIIRLMQDGVLTAVFPVGMKTMDLVFHQYDGENTFDRNAYKVAGIEIKGVADKEEK